MTRVLDRYVYREMLPAFAVGVALFTFLHVMDRVQDFINFAVSGAPLLLVFRVWMLLLLSFMTHTLPMGVLLAVVMATGRLASDLEVVALAASGVSPLRLVRPFLVFAIGVTLVMATLTLWVNPWGYAAFFRLLGELQQRAATPLIQERAFTRVGPIVIYAEHVMLGSSTLEGVLIGERSDAKSSRIVTAPRGTLLGDPERSRTVLRLTDGFVHESRPGADRYRVTAFTVYDAPLDVAAQVAARKRERSARDQTTWDLVSNTRPLEWTRGLEQAEMFILEFHKRLTFPAAPLVFALVGFPIGIRLRGAGRGVSAVSGIVVFLVYHLAQETLANVPALRPWGMGRWAPVILFGALGVVLLVGTTRPMPRWYGRVCDAFVDLGARGLRIRRLLSRGRTERPRRSARHGHVVDRYLLRQFVVYFVYGLTAAAAIFMVIDLLETLSNLPAWPALPAIVEHFVYRVPAALHQALPIVVLLAIVFLFMEMGRHHELTALKAAGMSLQRVALPVVLSAAALSVVSLLFQETMLPRLNARGEEFDRVKIRREAPRLLTIERDVWSRASDTAFVRVETVDRAHAELGGVSVLEVGPDFRVLTRLDVDRAVRDRSGWKIDRSVLREFGARGELQRLRSDVAAPSLPPSLDAFGPPQAPPAAMTFLQLRDYVRQLQDHGHQVGTWVLYLHSKLAFPMMSLVLGLSAIACAARWVGGGRLVGAAIAVAIAITYWVVNAIALACGRADLLPPIVAAWSANTVFAGLGAALFLRAPT